MSSPADPATVTRRRSLLQSLWFWVVLAFVVLIGAWTTMILLALKNSPEPIEVEHEEQIVSPAPATPEESPQPEVPGS